MKIYTFQNRGEDLRRILKAKSGDLKDSKSKGIDQTEKRFMMEKRGLLADLIRIDHRRESA